MKTFERSQSIPIASGLHAPEGDSRGPGPRDTSRLRKGKSGGNALIEWMLVILPTMALICFFIDVTWALFSWATIQNAAREGCRYAITFQTQTGLGQDASIENTVAQWSMGLVTTSQTFVSGGTTENVIQVHYFTQSAPTTPISATCSPTPCGNVPGNIVQVSVQGYSLTWLFPFTGTVVNPFRSSSPATISAYSYDVLGGYPTGTPSTGITQ
jgi:Flp pilus assembly protein TadG